MKVTVDYPGFGLGYFWSRCQAYNVLLLRRVANGSSCFERIGIGRVFGQEIEEQLKLITEELLWLV